MQDPHIRGSDSARLEDLQFLGEQAEYNFATSGIQSPPKQGKSVATEESEYSLVIMPRCPTAARIRRLPTVSSR